MFKHIIYTAMFVSAAVFLSGCEAEQSDSKGKQLEEHDENASRKESGSNMRTVHLSEYQFSNLDISVDTIPVRSLSGIVKANGQLEVPPQYEATVTPKVGANVESIQVIEGDRVQKGEVLAYLSHPDLIQLQKDYLKAVNGLEYLEQEMARQKRLNEEGIGSGKDLQKIQSDFKITQGEISGLEAQLQQIHLPAENIKNGNIYQQAPVLSPISGYVEKVPVQIGEYADERTTLVMIVNTDHIHADLMVFEKDMQKLQKGQRVRFRFEADPEKELQATIYSIGKQFEQKPKAVHVHAEIEGDTENLVPGMYIKSSVITDESRVKALPEEAIIEENGVPYFFTAEQIKEEGVTKWAFSPVEIRSGASNDGWVEVKPVQQVADSTRVALNNGYYLVSEMKKSQTSHSH